MTVLNINGEAIDGYIVADHQFAVFQANQVLDLHGAAFISNENPIVEDYGFKVELITRDEEDVITKTLLVRDTDYEINPSDIDLTSTSLAKLSDPTFGTNNGPSLIKSISMLIAPADPLVYTEIWVSYRTLMSTTNIISRYVGDLVSEFQTYGVDLTGEDAENLVTDERHYVNVPAGKQVIMPMAGSFYGHEVVVKHVDSIGNVTTLTDVVDYQIIGANHAKTKICSHNSGVYDYIFILKNGTVGEIQITYHAFGGDVSHRDMDYIKASVAGILHHLNNSGAALGTHLTDVDPHTQYLKEVDGIFARGDLYRIVSFGGTPAENAAHLQAEYDALYASSEGIRSATSRASLILLSGTCDFETGLEHTLNNVTTDNHGLRLYAEFIDIVAAGEVLLTSQIVTPQRGTVEQSADDVRILAGASASLTLEIYSNVTLASVNNVYADIPAAYYPYDPAANADPVFTKTIISGVTFSTKDAITVYNGYEIGYPTRAGISYAGLYENINTFDDDTPFLFGGDGTIIAGQIRNCVAGDYAFGMGDGNGSGGINGTVTSCKGVDYCFAFEGTVGANAVIEQCSGNDHCFGEAATVSGRFIECNAGDDGFACTSIESTGQILKCTAGANSFCNTGEISGQVINCIGGTDCFPSTADNIKSGSLIVGNTWSTTTDVAPHASANTQNNIVNNVWWTYNKALPASALIKSAVEGNFFKVGANDTIVGDASSVAAHDILSSVAHSDMDATSLAAIKLGDGLRWNGSKFVPAPFGGSLGMTFDVFMAKGSVNTTAGYFTHNTTARGYLGGGPTNDYMIDYVDSLGNTVTVTTSNSVTPWNNCFSINAGDTNKPLVRPSNCNITEIHYTFRALDGSGSAEHGSCTVIINWITGKYNAIYEFVDRGYYTTTCIWNDIALGYSNGGGANIVSYSYAASNNINLSSYWGTTAPAIFIEADRVGKLPIFLTNGQPAGTGDTASVEMIVKHYKTVSLTPDFSNYYIVGRSDQLIAGTADGNYIDDDHTAITGEDTFVEDSDGNTAWNTIMPISIASDVSKTVLKGICYQTASPGDANQEHMLLIEVCINWSENVVSGTYSVTGGTDITTQVVGIVTGTLAENDIHFTSVAGAWTDLPGNYLPVMEISGKTITKLPAFNGWGHVAYTLTNYRTVSADALYRWNKITATSDNGGALTKSTTSTSAMFTYSLANFTTTRSFNPSNVSEILIRATSDALGNDRTSQLPSNIENMVVAKIFGQANASVIFRTKSDMYAGTFGYVTVGGTSLISIPIVEGQTALEIGYVFEYGSVGFEILALR